MANLKELDPVQGLVEYVLDIKPYHTKIMEVLVEYVHTDLLDITIIDGHELEVEFLSSTEVVTIVCQEGGFAVGEFDGSSRVSILSPNVGIEFEDYPAINPGTNTIIVNTDLTKDVKIGDTVLVSTSIDDSTNTYNIFAANSGIAGTASFEIAADAIPGEFVIGYSFRAIGADINNGTYTVTAPGPSITGGPITVGWDISSFSSAPANTYTPALSTSSSAYVTPDGDFLFYVENTTVALRIYKQPLATPFDISTAGAVTSTSLTNQSSFDTVQGITFSQDGLTMIITNQNEDIHQYSCASPWEIVSPQPTFIQSDTTIFDSYGNVSHVAISNDGTRVIACDITSIATASIVYNFEMSTPWDVSTIAPTQIHDFFPTEGAIFTSNIFGQFSFDGTKYFVATDPGAFTRLYEWTLATPFDLTTATFESFVDRLPEAESAGKFFFTDDGVHMYFHSADSPDVIYQYDTGSVVASGDPSIVTIPVAQSIPSSIPVGSIGLVTTPGTNNGYFTVQNIEFNGGSIDSWPDLSDPTSYNVGDSPHTVITFIESLNPITVFAGSPAAPELTHNAFLLVDPVDIERSLSYSRASNIYTPGSPSSIIQTPNEGNNYVAIVDVTITGGSPTAYGQFVIEGNYAGSNLFVGDEITISSSAGNNGVYTLVSLNYDSGTNRTTFEVSEAVVSATINGFASFYIPANVFIVDGSRTTQFTQGRQFLVTGGTFEKIYTVLNSVFLLGKTHVRVAESIIESGSGLPIVGIDNGFVVPGNQTSVYPTGITFNVSGSLLNDGQYTVAGSPGPVYDPIALTTTIPVGETLVNIAGGEIHIALVGTLQRRVYDFDEASPICGIVPEANIHVYVSESLRFTGLGITIHDDIIAYNLENNDPGGYDLPLRTIINSVQPTIVEQNAAPFATGSPALIYQQLWFDTSNIVPGSPSLGSGILKIWNNYKWEAIPKAYWFDTASNLLYYIAYYRSGGAIINTGWVLDSLRMPGFSDVLPAVGELQQIGTESFPISEVIPGVFGTTFTLTDSISGSPPDKTLIRVFVNDVPANFTLDSSDTFTILSPILLENDSVRADLFDRSTQELNAHVTPLDVKPYTVFHSGVGVDTTNNAYVVSGGNFMDRFVAFNNVEGFNTTSAGSPLIPIDQGTWNATTFPIAAINGTDDTFTIDGDYTWLFTAGRVLRVNPSENNYFDFTIVSSGTVGSPVQTVITVVQSVSDTDISYTVQGSPAAPIFNVNEPYSRDMGVILGSVYDPALAGTGVYDTTQPKTIFVPTAPVSEYVDSISYIWIGPVRFDIGLNPSDFAHQSIVDALGISNEVLGFPSTFDILDTDIGVGSPLAPDTFTIHYDELVVAGSPGITVSQPVDLGQKYSSGTIFTVAGSFSNDEPSTLETNDAMYVVKSTFFDEGGTGDTIITIETDFAKIPPFDFPVGSPPVSEKFVVVEVSNNIGIGSPAGSPLQDKFNTITFDGDLKTLFETFDSGKFRFDQPIVSASPLYNLITVTNIEIVGGNTVLTVQEEFIDEAFTGPIGIIDAKYRANIYYDETNVAGSPTTFEHGRIVSEAFQIGQTTINTASAQFVEEMLFGWGEIHRWPIVDVNLGSNTVDLYGDFTAIVQPNDRVEIKGGTGDIGGSPAQTNNGDHEAAVIAYNAGTNITTVTIENPDLAIDPPLVNINVPILSTGAGSPVVRTFIIDGEDGLHVNFLRPGTTFTVEDGMGSPLIPNTGTYTVVTAVHDSLNDTITVTTVEDIPSSSAAGYIQYIKKDAGFLEMDNIDITNWFQYTIKEIIPTSSDIIINGNATVDVQSGQEVRALGTLANNGILTASDAPIFNIRTNTTTLPVAEPLNYGENDIAEITDTNVVKVLGNAAYYLGAGRAGSPNLPWGGAGSPAETQSIGGGSPNLGDELIIAGSTGNDGSYTVQGSTFDGVYSFITLTTDLPDSTPDGIVQYRDRGGWIESLRYQGITLRFTDSIEAGIIENADAVVLTTAGSLVGAWDYQNWDLGSFDESLGTVIHLYSNTF